MADLIDRQAAIATAISGRVRTLPTTEDGEDWIRVNEVRDSLLTLPSAQPERKTGRWITDYLVGISGASYRIYRCSECASYYESVGLWPRRYCPNCGAKMEEEAQEHGTTD